MVDDMNKKRHRKERGKIRDEKNRNEKNREEKKKDDIIIRQPRNSKVLLRKKELFNELSDNKLEYRKNGICDSFIKFGTPSLNVVIQTVQEKTESETNRLIKLLKCLKRENELYDKNNSYYKKYIRNGGDLEYHVNEGIIEWFYCHKTEYTKLLAKYKNADVAEAEAFNRYIRKNGNDRYTERIRKNEMIVSIN